MFTKVAITICLSSIVLFTKAQITWPKITQQNKPWARWWWQGSTVDKRNILLNLQDYRAAGLGGMEITPIYGVHGYEKQFIEFLSPEFMRMLDHTLKEAKRIGIGIDLANGTGWPFGGPTTLHKDASKTIVHKVYTVRAGDGLKDQVSFHQNTLLRSANPNNKNPGISEINPAIAKNNNLQELALDQVKFPGQLPLRLLMAYADNGEVLDLTNKVNALGELHWNAPLPGADWTLYALFEGLHGKMVERAAPGGEGYAIDHFSSAALNNYFKRFDAAFKGHDISYIRALFNDSYEVDDASGQSNWTPKLFDEFKQRRGYDLKMHLPALFGKADTESNLRVLFDYRTTIGELILEDFTMEWKKWGKSKGAIIRNQSHGSPANLLDLYSAIDIPETEGDDILRYKFATSVAHVMGKPLASSESATWLNEHFLSSWSDVKKAVDLFLLGGVNHIFYHGVAYSPKEEKWPGWLFYAAVHFQQTNPQWKDFHTLNEYIARVQSFMQKGKPANDILVYYPLDDRYSIPENALLQHFDGMGKEFAGTDFEKISTWMMENGYSFDFFSDKQLQNFTQVGKKTITGGNTYQTILLPANKFISDKSFQKLVELAKSGATILVYKNLPADVPGFARLEENRSAFKSLVNQLQFTSINGVRKAWIGKGSFIIAGDMHVLLTSGGIRKETLHENGLQFIRRKNTDGYTYFIDNRSNKEVNKWVAVNEKATSIVIYDAMNAKAGLANHRTTNNGTIEVMLQLKPFESAIVQLLNTKKTGNNFPYTTPIARAETINNDWTVTFLNGGPVLPKTFTTSLLASWTEQADEAYKHFSGTAKYSTTFAKPATRAAGWKLDLGTISETADVIINGKKLTTLIGPDYSVIIPATMLTTNNTLEIVVANLMANRIIYMDKNKIEWKKFYNTNMPARRKENSKNGLFDASSWTPLPSGLLGPVTLTPVKFNIK